MKKWIFGLLVAFSTMLILPSCNRKSGCPATESLKATEKKGGGYKRSGKTKSGLYPQKMRKKVGVRG
jgi:hypothetical protein